jgi:DNA excision repair protein ERCC-4
VQITILLLSLLLTFIWNPGSKILVDHREFRSPLPAYLYRQGFEVYPCHLEVGDYILAPHICVERKSISDLHSSFNSGRLYQLILYLKLMYEFSYFVSRFKQVEAMSRRFSVYCLLIEFDENRPFCLQPEADFGDDIRQGSISSRLVLLTLHFPSLRLLWSRSPHTTALLFERVKKLMGKGEPDPDIVNISRTVAGNLDEGTVVAQVLPSPSGWPYLFNHSDWRGTSRVESMMNTFCMFSSFF